MEKNPQARIDQIAEVIAELKDPMSQRPPRLTTSLQETVVDNVDHKLIRTLQLKIAELQVKQSEHKDDLDAAISEEDFIKAQEVKTRMKAVIEQRKALETEVENEKGKVMVVEKVVEHEEEPRDDPAVTLKCLKLLVATLQDPAIRQLNATLQTLLEELVVIAVQSESATIRKEAITSLACFCLRSVDDARHHMLLLLQVAHIDVPDVRIAAITAVIDLLMMHGLQAFITQKEDKKDLSGTEGELSETSSSIETALDSDLTMRGATLTQNELDTQGGNSVVVILSKMLDEPDLELRTEVAEGLCKLLMIGSISSSKLLSRLLLIWYNPMTESDSKLRHILGTFFPLYASMSKAHQLSFESAFLPTMKVLFDAPVTSPLAEIDCEDVGMFFVHLTREDMLQSYTGKAPMEGESSVTSVHDSLAAAVCNEILSSPDSMQTKTLIKILSSLQITHNNFVALRELKVLAEQLLNHVKDKLCRKSLEKFNRIIAEWLAKDPAKAETADKRPAPAAAEEANPADDTMDVTGTPKRKRILFSQSVLGNPLLNVEEEEEVNIESDGTASGSISESATPRKIPSPVARVAAPPLATSTRESFSQGWRLISCSYCQELGQLAS